jgi:hypothetical protein
VDDAFDGADSRLAASPMISEFISRPSTAATTTSSAPMSRVPTASQRPSPVTSVSPTPNRANTRPHSAAVSSRRTTGSSGAFAVRMYSTQEREPRDLFDSTIAVRNEYDSRQIATRSTTIGTHHQRPVMGSGCCHLCTPS